MTRRLRIGLTGGIASGKSTVGDRFQELGVPVIDADVASRAVVGLGTTGLIQVARRFGQGVLSATGELNRAALRELIFDDIKARQDLEGILHPLIRTYMEEHAAVALGPYLVMAIPLLVEQGRPHDRVDRVLVIDVDEAVQIHRVMARDGSSMAHAHAILASQASRAARLQAADDVIANTGSVTDLRHSVDRLHENYLRLGGSAAPTGNLT
jgi:dephospho-CoA kinase